MAKRSYRPGRNRRIAQPGTPGGVARGVNVCAYEFRGVPGTVMNVSVHVMGTEGTLQAAELLAEIGDSLPVENLVMLNASMPGPNPTILQAIVIAPGVIEIEFDGLGLDEIGTILIPPMNPGWGDRSGRVFGGLYASVPSYI